MKLLQIIFLFIGSTSKVLSLVWENETCLFHDGSPGLWQEYKYCGEGKVCSTSMDMDVVHWCQQTSSSQGFCEQLYATHPWAGLGLLNGRRLVASGEATEYGEFPYMAALGWETDQPNVIDYKCGGAMISNNFVVTAAHCAYVGGRQPVVILPGGVNLTESNPETYPIITIIVHPEYRANMSYHDIALVEFPSGRFFPRKRVACLWIAKEMLHTTFTVIGYGNTKFAGRGSNQLLKAHLHLVDPVECQDYYEDDRAVPSGIHNTQLCAKDPKEVRDTCQGDSGGPIIMYTYDSGVTVPYLVGITSFGQGCAHEPPGVYTRISSYIDWIEGIMWPTVSSISLIVEFDID